MKAMTGHVLAGDFCKTAACPSSQTLLRYRRHHLPLQERATVEIHLRTCDFCSAELQLLQRHRINVENCATVEMPGNLRRLAEELLARKSFAFARADFPKN
jgi:hypothetical protein